MNPEMCQKSIPKWIPKLSLKLRHNGVPKWYQNGRREKPREKKVKKYLPLKYANWAIIFFTFFSRGFPRRFSRRPFWDQIGGPFRSSFGIDSGIHFGIDFGHISGSILVSILGLIWVSF